jgi:GTPase Era involved in 16S rRNA processing
MSQSEGINIENYKNSYNYWVSFRKKTEHEIVDAQIDLYEKIFHEFVEAQRIRVVELINGIKSKKGIDSASLLKEKLDDLDELVHKIEALETSFDKPFVIFVVGMGKAGKSTLLNALIGKNVAAMDSLPKTWKIDLFWKSTQQKQVCIVHRDGTKRFVDFESAKKIINDEENKREISEDVVDQKFKEKAGLCKTVEEKEDLKNELSHKYIYRSSIREVHWPMATQDNSSILNKFSLVDTPGVWQNYTGAHKEDISDFYHQADGILWVLDSTTLSASKPKEILDKLEAILKKVGVIKPNNVIAVLNRIDRVRENGGLEMVNKVVNEANLLFKGKFLDVVPYSAKEAWLSKRDKTVGDIGHETLLKTIDKYFYKDVLRTRIDGKISNLKALIKNESMHYSGYTLRLKKDNERRCTIKKELENELASLKASLLQDWVVVSNDISASITKKIESRTQTYLDIDNKSQQEIFFRDQIIGVDDFSLEVSKYRKKINDRCGMVRAKYLEKSAFTAYKFSKIIDTEVNSGKALALVGVNSAFGVLQGLALVLEANNPFEVIGGLAVAVDAAIGWVASMFNPLGMAKKRLQESKDKMLTIATQNMSKLIDETISAVDVDVARVREVTFASIHSSSENFDELMSVSKQLSIIAESNLHQVSLADILLERQPYELARMV